MAWITDEKLVCDCCGKEMHWSESRECPRCEGYICPNCIRYDDSAIPEEQERYVNCHEHYKNIATNHLSDEMGW